MFNELLLGDAQGSLGERYHFEWAFREGFQLIVVIRSKELKSFLKGARTFTHPMRPGVRRLLAEGACGVFRFINFIQIFIASSLVCITIRKI